MPLDSQEETTRRRSRGELSSGGKPGEPSPRSLYSPTPSPVQPNLATSGCLELCPPATLMFPCVPNTCNALPGSLRLVLWKSLPGAFPGPSPAELGDPFPSLLDFSRCIRLCIRLCYTSIYRSTLPTKATVSARGSRDWPAPLPHPRIQPSLHSRHSINI